MIKKIKFPLHLSLLIIAGVPILIDAVLKSLWPHLHWENELLHAVVETAGAVIAIVMAILLFLKHTDKFEDNFYFLAMGFLSMGIFDGFHAISKPGDSFVFLHSIASLFGGFWFVLAWFPAPVKHLLNKNVAFWAVILSSLLWGIWIYLLPETIPSMIHNGEFTTAAIAINSFSGIMFIFAAFRFSTEFYRVKTIETYMFACMSLLFAVAEITFYQSSIWDGGWWVWHLLRLVAYILVVLFIIRQYIKIAAMQKESEDRYRGVVEDTPVLVCCFDSDYKLTFVNNAYCSFYDKSSKELVGSSFLTLVPETDQHFVKDNIAALNSEFPEQSHDHRAVTPDGEICWQHWTNRGLFDAQGQVIGYQSIGLDITGRKRAEKEKTQLEAQLQQSQKMESIGTLAGGIAHDFNNILFPIVGHTEMLIEDVPEGSPLQESLDEIYAAALRAKELVKQILTFSRQEASELKLMKMQPIIKEALKLIRSTVPTTIKIKQNIQTDCGVIKADPTQIHQIIMNLTTNAYHAMEETGGILKVSLKEKKLTVNDLISPDMAPGIYACLTVADTGKGMDRGVSEKIFEPFFSTKEIGKGTGMGLSVVHGIILGMNGSIHVNSKPGKGTKFHIYLPVFETHSEKQEFKGKKIIQGGTERILLVDDEVSIIAMEKRMLTRLGYQVTSRTSSVEALEAFKNNSDKFDMVITDMAMPNLAGDKFAVELTKIRPDIPILLCTGFSETMSKKRAASLGINGFLFKPIVIGDLSAKIREVLDINLYE